MLEFKIFSACSYFTKSDAHKIQPNCLMASGVFGSRSDRFASVKEQIS